MATGSLVTLTALAVHSARQVVAPFVQNSKFEASKDQEHVKSPTLGLGKCFNMLSSARASLPKISSWENFLLMR